MGRGRGQACTTLRSPAISILQFAICIAPPLSCPFQRGACPPFSTGCFSLLPSEWADAQYLGRQDEKGAFLDILLWQAECPNLRRGDKAAVCCGALLRCTGRDHCGSGASILNHHRAPSVRDVVRMSLSFSQQEPPREKNIPDIRFA
jgi:hypothetical protein